LPWLVARLAASQACSGPVRTRGQRVLPDELHARLLSATRVEVARGPEDETYPRAADETLATIEDAGVTRRLVETLQVGGLEQEVVVQAHAGLTLTFFDGDQDYIDTITLLPGWARYGGWPYDARLLTPAAVSSILTELGVSLPWSSAALRAVYDVEPHLPAARRKGAGGDDELPIWTHLFVERIDESEPRLDTLLRIVADDATAGVIITNPKLTWLYHPYDGGADVIAANPQDRDELRSRHVDWLPAHPDGM
jgi:hypothetical protein